MRPGVADRRDASPAMRDRRLEVRLTTGEFAILRDAADAAGVSMSDVIRMHLLGAAHAADRTVNFERTRDVRTEP
jgi:uncharacterized protein (DUF1778 family)